MPTATAAALIIAPFTIEADHPRNCDLKLMSIPGVRLRSMFNGMKSAKDKNGNEQVPVDQALTFASFPTTPGEQITVDPAKCTYEIADPLTADVTLCERIANWKKQHLPGSGDQKVAGNPTRKGTLDPHRMKTLCRELLRIVESGEAKFVKGLRFTQDEAQQLPGKFLLNAGMQTATTQPVYEDDYPAWVDRLSHSGG